MTKSICIVGAGLAGGVLAYELCRSGYHVTLVECGDEPIPYEPANENWIYERPKAAFTRGIGIGGTSNYWHGGLTVLDKIDVDADSPYFGVKKLPIDYDELLEYCRRALDIIEPDNRFTLTDITSTPNMASNDFRINSNCFKYKGLVYPKTTFSTRKSILDSISQYNLNVIRKFEVKLLIFSNETTVSSIEGISYETGEECKRICADIFVLCAGGLGTPKILLNSRKHQPSLSRLPIGKYLTDHPTGFAFKAKLRKRMNLGNIFGQTGNGFRIQYGFTLKPECTGISSNLNHILYLRPAIGMKDPVEYDVLKRKLVGYKGKKLKLSDIFYLFRHTDLLYEAVNFKFGLFPNTRYVSGLVFLDQSPNARDSINLNDENEFDVKWGISESDADTAYKFMKTFLDSHPDVFENYIVFQSLNNRLETAGHHSGACRMSSNPETGVVDKNLKVFGVNNLFIVDGSVLGHAGHANTGLTIMALALKCADVIRDS